MLNTNYLCYLAESIGAQVHELQESPSARGQANAARAASRDENSSIGDAAYCLSGAAFSGAASGTAVRLPAVFSGVTLVVVAGGPAGAVRPRGGVADRPPGCCCRVSRRWPGRSGRHPSGRKRAAVRRAYEAVPTGCGPAGPAPASPPASAGSRSWSGCGHRRAHLGQGDAACAGSPREGGTRAGRRCGRCRPRPGGADCRGAPPRYGLSLDGADAQTHGGHSADGHLAGHRAARQRRQAQDAAVAAQGGEEGRRSVLMGTPQAAEDGGPVSVAGVLVGDRAGRPARPAGDALACCHHVAFVRA